MYEVELKVELTAQEKDLLLEQFVQRGFTSEGVTPQKDFYIHAEKSPHGGYDLKRYRQEGDKFIYTEKTWEMVDGMPARQENEREVSEEEFLTETAKYPDAVKVIKDREWFAGSHEGREISLTIDTVKFDHSPNVRYFTEAEIGVSEKEQVRETKEFIDRFLSEMLGKPEGVTEAPGMFSMAFNKL